MVIPLSLLWVGGCTRGYKIIIRQEGRGREKDAKDRKESMNGRKERDKKDICGNILNIKYHINK